MNKTFLPVSAALLSLFAIAARAQTDAPVPPYHYKGTLECTNDKELASADVVISPDFGIPTITLRYKIGSDPKAEMHLNPSYTDQQKIPIRTMITAIVNDFLNKAEGRCKGEPIPTGRPFEARLLWRGSMNLIS